jgi:thioredoxin 1
MRQDTGVVVIDSAGALQALASAEPALAVYFSAPDCGVCEALYPRLVVCLQEFPRVTLARADCAATPELAAQLGVLSIPTLIIYLDGHEAIRKVRHFSLAELAGELSRPYRLLFHAD